MREKENPTEITSVIAHVPTLCSNATGESNHDESLGVQADLNRNHKMARVVGSLEE